MFIPLGITRAACGIAESDQWYRKLDKLHGFTTVGHPLGDSHLFPIPVRYAGFERGKSERLQPDER